MSNKTNLTKTNNDLKPTEELKKLIEKATLPYFEVLYKSFHTVNRGLGSNYAKLVRETLIEKGIKKSHINTMSKLSTKLKDLSPNEFALNDFSLVKFMKEVEELQDDYGIDWQDFLEGAELQKVRDLLLATDTPPKKGKSKKKAKASKENISLFDEPTKVVTPNYHKGLQTGSPSCKEAFTLLVTQDTLSEEFGRNRFDWELEEVILNKYSEELNLRQTEYLLQKIIEADGYDLLPKLLKVPELDKIRTKLSKIFNKVNNVGLLNSKDFAGLFYILLFRVFQFIKESNNSEEGEKGLEVVDMVVFQNLFNIALEREFEFFRAGERSLLEEFTKDMNEGLIPAFVDQIRSDVHNFCNVKGIKSALSIKSTDEFMLHLTGGFNWVVYIFHSYGIISEGLLEDILARQNIVSYNGRRVVKIISEISKGFK